MYQVIGLDGREYGPAGADQIRQWASEGRVNGRTRVKSQETSGWIPLGSLPEFADIFPGAVPPPPSPPPPAPVEVRGQPWSATDVGPDYRIGIGECISRGWKLVMQNFWLLVGASFLAGVIITGAFIPYLGFLISIVVAGPMIGGVFLLYLRKIRGEPVIFGDMFAGFGPSFGSLFAAHVVSMILVLLGLILFILPGIYLLVSWTFALPLIIDRKMDFWEAMELSRKMVTKHWWKMFGLVIVLMLLGLAGLVVFFVGVFVAAAVGQAALAHAYEDIFIPRHEQPVVIP